MCWLSFLTSPFLSTHCQIGQGMQVNSSRWHHVPPRIFSSSPTLRFIHSSSKTNAHWLLSAGRIRLSRLLWLLRQVFRFDFYHKFSAKVSEYFTRPTTGGRNFVFNPGCRWIEIFLQSSKRTNSGTADIALNGISLVLTNQKVIHQTWNS